MSDVIYFLGGLAFALLCGLAGIVIAWLLFGRTQKARGDSDA
ncbi:hypothetical protein [Halomonas sp. H2]